MARRTLDVTLSSEVWHFVVQLASEHGASQDATFRILQYVAEGLPSLRASRINSRTQFAFAGEVVESAYEALGPRRAQRLIRQAGLPTLDERLAAAEYLVKQSRENGLPLYSLEELADRLVQFRKFIGDDREHLLSTGLPSRFLKPCRWLWHSAGNLYPTRRTTALLPFEKPRQIRGKPAFYRWARFIPLKVGSKLEPCDFADADPVARITVAEELKLIELRGRLLDAKMGVLAKIALGLRDGDASDLFAHSMEALSDFLSSEEIAFCLRCDTIYRDVPKNRPNVHPIIVTMFGLPSPVNPGGIGSLLRIVWHAENELKVGTMRFTREALGRLVVERASDNVLDAMATHVPYFDLIAGGRRRQVDRALDKFAAYEDLAANCWRDFKKRLRSALNSVPSTKDAIDQLDRDSLRSLIEEAVRHAVSRSVIAPSTPSSAVSAGGGKESKAADRVLVRFPSPPGLTWEDVKMEFVSNDSIKITVGKTSKRYTFAELGFKDHRKGDLPDKLWGILRALARARGTADWGSEIKPSDKPNLKASIKDIRKRLKALMGLEHDPFHPYQKRKAYVTKFKICDSSFLGPDKCHQAPR